MQIAIRYFTKSKKGNTFKLATAVSEALSIEAKTVADDLENDVDILFLVNAMYMASIDKEVKRFLDRNARLGAQPRRKPNFRSVSRSSDGRGLSERTV